MIKLLKEHTTTSFEGKKYSLVRFNGSTEFVEFHKPINELNKLISEGKIISTL